MRHLNKVLADNDSPEDRKTFVCTRDERLIHLQISRYKEKQAVDAALLDGYVPLSFRGWYYTNNWDIQRARLGIKPKIKLWKKNLTT